MERELLLLRKLVESALPSCYRLEEVDVTIGSLWPGQEPSFKAVIRVVQVAEDEADETLGWGHDLTERIRAFWSRDDLYVSIHERSALEQDR